MGYITKEQALAALGLEPEVWCENDPVEIQKRNDWYYYRDAIEAVPEVDAEPVIKSHWQLVDEKNGTGVCGNCHRQDHIDPLARYCRYCGARLVEEGENMEVQRKCEYNLNNNKPKICEILGVEPGESFYIQGFDGVVFWIMDDGTFTTQPNNALGSSTALLRALEHPEWVEHLPSWSPDEVTLARVFLDACYSKEDVFFARTGNGRLCWGVDSEGMDLRENILPMCLFPQIKCGQKVYLRDIVGESGSEEDEI